MAEKIANKLYGNVGLWCFILLVAATLASFFPILVLRDGGSWTFFSLLFLWLITYVFGVKKGCYLSVLFGFIKFVVTYISEPEAANAAGNFLMFFLEYIIACGGFCIGGFLPQNRRCEKYINSVRKARNINELFIKDKLGNEIPPLNIDIEGDIEAENSASGLIVGCLLGLAVMFVCYVAAAPMYNLYPTDITDNLGRFIYDVKYDGSYLLGEAMATVILLMIEPVRNIVFRLKHIANNPMTDHASNSL